MDTGDSKKKQEKKGKGEGRFRWAIQVFFLSVVLSAVLSLASEEALDGAGMALAFVVLACFILLGIVFDIIGVAVTAADERPFHSMAAHKTPGAREALGLIRKASKVSSFCNDVVGDICGIISGSTAAIIVTGNEVKKGLIQDTFSPVVAEKLASYGVETRSVVQSGDGVEAVAQAVNIPSIAVVHKAVRCTQQRQPSIEVAAGGSAIGFLIEPILHIGRLGRGVVQRSQLTQNHRTVLGLFTQARVRRNGRQAGDPPQHAQPGRRRV